MSLFEFFVSNRFFQHLSPVLIDQIRGCSLIVYKRESQTINEDIFSILVIYAIEMFLSKLVDNPLQLRLPNEDSRNLLRKTLKRKVDFIKEKENTAIAPFAQAYYRVMDAESGEEKCYIIPNNVRLNNLSVNTSSLKPSEFITVGVKWCTYESTKSAYNCALHIYAFILLSFIRDYVKDPQYALHTRRYMLNFFADEFRDYWRNSLIPAMQHFLDNFQNELLVRWTPNRKIVTNAAPSSGSSNESVDPASYTVT